MTYILPVVVAIATLYGSWAQAMDAATSQGIVDKHNELRGQVDPAATDMIKMYWSDDLAAAAETFIDTCPDDHDDNEARAESAGLGISVGQNLAYGYNSWDDAVQAWYDENTMFTYGFDSGSGTFHFTQLALARSSHIGCAYKECTGSTYGKYYVCNYAHQQLNTDVSAPWTEGTACSQCGGTCSNNLCDCGDQLCVNGGVLDSSTCTCQCVGAFTGDLCEIKDCPGSDPSYCGEDQPWGYPPDFCDLYSNVRDECPYMCGICWADCGDQLCVNEGVLDANTCTCQCVGVFTGDLCEISDCPDSDVSYCGQDQPWGYPPEFCDLYSNVPEECPYMCGIC